MKCVKTPAVCIGGFCIACRVFKSRVRQVAPPEEPGVVCTECGAVSRDAENWSRWFKGPAGRKCFRCMRIMKPLAASEVLGKGKPKKEEEGPATMAVAETEPA